MLIVLALRLLALGQSPADFAPGVAAAVSIERVPEGLRILENLDGVSKETALLKVGPIKDVLRHGTTVFAALEDGGVAVVDLRDAQAPVQTTRLLEGRPVAQLGHQGESVLVVLLADRDTAAFDLSDPLHPQRLAAALAKPEVPASTNRGHVLAVGEGEVVFDVGHGDGFHLGEHVRVESLRAPGAQDRLSLAAGLAPAGVKTAVVVLERVEAHRSVAHLGRGDLAAVGDEVSGTRDDPSESIVAPHWVPFAWRLSVGVRPFLDLDNTGSHAVGLLTDATVAYYFPGLPLRLEAGLQPLGLAFGGAAQHDPTVAVLDAAFASPYFEIGLGTGFSALATASECQPLAAPCRNNSFDPLIVETLRLGALDGLNLIWRSSIASSDQGFVFNSGRAETNFPVSTRFTLFLDAGGGRAYAFGDAGLRAYLGGLGGPGTLILSAGLGGASISDNGETLLGPSVLFNLEARL